MHARKNRQQPVAKPEFLPYTGPFWTPGFEFLRRAKDVIVDLARFAANVVWPKIKEVAVSLATLTWRWTKRVAIAAGNAVAEFCDRLLKPVREVNAERRLEQSLCIHSDVQNLEVAGVFQPFTKSPPRNKNQIPEALAA